MFTSRWETPPLTAATAGRPFEFVILDSPEIVLAPDPLTFGEHFWRAGPGGVVEFANLGGGVAWLHVRLDDRPKYYGYMAYHDGV